MSRLYLKFFCSAALLCSGFLSAVPAQSPAPRRNAAASQQSVAATEETQVAVVLSIISVPESFWEEMPLDLSLDAKSAPNHVAFMNDVQTDRFMEALQGNARTNVMASPKLTMFDGQASTITVGQTQYFVTGVDMHWTGENMMAVPHSEPYHLGLTAHFVPRVTADRHFVCLNMDAMLSSLDSAVAPLSPVTAMITPTYEGGAQGAPVPFTQYVQQPRISKISVNQTLCIPDSGTALFFAGKRTSEGAGQFGPQVLSKIPYVNKVSKTTGQSRQTECVLFLVTPRILLNEQEEARPPAERFPSPQKAAAAKPALTDSGAEESECLTPEQCTSACSSCRNAHLQRLMEAYRAACAAGKLADAKRLATDALSIDPACFCNGK